MTMPEPKRRRTSLRLPQYDYSWPGAYFITIVTDERRLLLESSEARAIGEAVWHSLPTRFPQTRLDAFVVMPNHVHGILMLDPENVGAIHELPLHNTTRSSFPEDRASRRQMLLPKVIGFFKTNVAKQLNVFLGTPGRKVWQRNYYEHIVRAEEDLNTIRNYVNSNPGLWEQDPENPRVVRQSLAPKRPA